MSEMLHVIVIDALHVYAKLLGEMAGSFLRKLLEQRLELAVRCRMSDASKVCSPLTSRLRIN
jgi:hypothetical protein